jgi:sugar phosphate isomerase/epimerase
MQTPLSRRNFLITAGATSVAAASSSKIALGETPAAHDDAQAKKPFEISIAEWSLHRTIRSGKISNLDFPKVAREEFGIAGVEYVNQFFKDKAEDEKYLADLNQRCQDSDVKSLLIMVDGEGAIGDADSGKRTKAVENHFKWVTAAKTLGCHSIRVNAQSAGNYGDQVNLAADGLRRLSGFAKDHGINVLVENHGGLSSNGQWLAQVIRRVDMNNCGTLPDFGNFRISRGKNGNDVHYDRYLGMAALLPFAKALSAKSREFDEAGNETESDFEKMIGMALDAGYRGFVGVEYEGKKLGEYEGVKATKKLLERCQEKFADRA